MEKYKLPRSIAGGSWDGGHVQGIAVDMKARYVYYSFTTILVKADFSGNVIGTVTGLLGHLGCIDYNEADGRVYGSLELKHDAIGQGIMSHTGKQIAKEDAFYIAIFDVDKIDRVGMEAEKDNVMTAVYLHDVLRDYMGVEENGCAHRYGCSGIDGTGLGPVFGNAKDSPQKLLVAYGIYGETKRSDNDYQVILQYDWRSLGQYAHPLMQEKPHKSGPKAEERYFLYTGNTDWGIQNLEYDPYTGDWYAAVYTGRKPQFPNYPMFVIDGSKAPVEEELKGRNGERGLVLHLKEEGCFHSESGIHGLSFGWGQTGICSLGNGLFYVSQEGYLRNSDKPHTTTVRLYRRAVGTETGFVLVSD